MLVEQKRIVLNQMPATTNVKFVEHVKYSGQRKP